MESSIQTLRRSALQNLTDGNIEKARVVIAAMLGTLFTDRAEQVFARNALAELFEADEDRIRVILRGAYDRAQRVDYRRRTEEVTSRPRFPNPRHPW